MINKTRKQLTLFVEQKDAETIEQIRQKFNPEQFKLIKCHVTLCREDEIENLEQVLTNLFLLTQPEIVIEFEKITRFDNGKGLFLSATNANAAFQVLRKQVLVGIIDNPRRQQPHITLIHPRNSTCTDYIFAQVEKVTLPTKLKFRRISLIEQKDSGQWRVLQEFEFQGNA